MKWIKLKDTVINLDAISFVNLYLDRPTPMVQVCFQGDNGFLNFEDAGDVTKLLDTIEAETTTSPGLALGSTEPAGSWEAYKHRTGK